ncbi:hypothetical protein OAA57_00065 [bacterium]|jgi:hypothetical protein|nr:hypothetical protein [bacterium]MDB4349955.1 hypothetical protein [bacterium]
MAPPNSRDTLIEYCKRRLGDPVLEINVDEDQIEDRVDEAIQYYQEYHTDATIRTYLKHQVTASDKANEYIPISSDILYVSKLFPMASSFNSSFNFFDIKYQMMLNDIADLQNFAGDLAYYDQMQQYLSLLDMKLNGAPQVNFSRHQDRLYIFGDFQDDDIIVGEYVVAEVYSVLDPDTYTSIYNDMWLKEYTTALIKQQWGQNLIKFEGIVMPGGVTFNGRQLYDDATQEIQALRERIRDEFELPPDFMVG